MVIKANGQLYSELAELVNDAAILHVMYDENHSQGDDVYLYQIKTTAGSE